ncbi:MAG: alpha/beta hydrolase family protein [Telluria sp.]
MRCSFLLGPCVAALLLGAVPAAAAPIPAAHFVGPDKYRAPLLSPDGKHLAVTTDLPRFWGTTTAIVVLAVPSLKVESALALERFRVPQSYRWISPTRLVVAEATTYTYANVPIPTGLLMSTEYDGSRQQHLFGPLISDNGGRRVGGDAAKGRIAGVPAALDGHVAVVAWPDDVAVTRLLDIDSATNTRVTRAALPRRELDFLVDGRGAPRFAYAQGFDGAAYARWFDPAAQAWVPDSADGQNEPLAPLWLSADGTVLYEEVERPHRATALTSRQLGSAARRTIVDEPVFSPLAYFFASDTRQPWGYLAGGPRPEVRYLDPQAPAAELHRALSAKFPGELVRLASTTRDLSRALVHVASDRDPGSFYLYDRATGRADLLLSVLDQLDPAALAPREPIHFKARDGLELHGFLTAPPGVAHPPLVVLPHGGPHEVADQWWFDPDAAFLASRGYAVLQLNFRGSGGRGADFEKAGWGQWNQGMIDDLLDGIEWLARQQRIDPDRVAAVGFSYGAYAAMQLAARAPQRIRCVVGVAGAYDLERLDTVRSRHYFDTVIGTGPARAAQSALQAAARIQAPVLLVHGKLDGRTRLEQAERMRDALRAAGHPPEYVSLTGEGHSFSDANRTRLYELLEEFLSRHLGAPPAGQP